MEPLIDLFRIGETALMANNYLISRASFEHILREGFVSREIFNNLGVTFALEALELMPADSMPFMVPFEFDAQTRLDNGSERDISETDAARQEYLVNKAIEFFDKSVHLDRDYGVGKMNLGLAYLINHELTDSRYWLEKSKSDLGGPELGAYYCSMGVLEFYSGDSSLSRQYFDQYDQISAASTKISTSENTNKVQTPHDQKLSLQVDIHDTISLVNYAFGNAEIYKSANYTMKTFVIKEKRSTIFKAEYRSQGDKVYMICRIYDQPSKLMLKGNGTVLNEDAGLPESSYTFVTTRGDYGIYSKSGVALLMNGSIIMDARSFVLY